MPRSLSLSRAETATTSIARGQCSRRISAFSARSFTTPLPTVPRPAMPTRNGRLSPRPAVSLLAVMPGADRRPDPSLASMVGPGSVGAEIDFDPAIACHTGRRHLRIKRLRITCRRGADGAKRHAEFHQLLRHRVGARLGNPLIGFLMLSVVHRAGASHAGMPDDIHHAAIGALDLRDLLEHAAIVVR